MYRIGELAKMAEVTPDTIRYYEKQQMMEFFVFQKQPFVFGPVDKPVSHLNCGICCRTSHLQFPLPLTEFQYKTLI